MFVAAIILRLIDITDALWLDEAFTLHFLREYSYIGLVLELPVDDVHPPLYYVLLKPIVTVFGTSELALRSLSIVASAATVPVIAEIGRKIHSRQSGLIAAIVVVVAPYQVLFAQEARMYALLILLTAVSYLTLLGSISQPSWRRIVVYTVSTFLLAMTHAFALFVVVAQNVTIATILVSRWISDSERHGVADIFSYLQEESLVVRWAVSQVALLTLISPWIYILATKSSNQEGARTFLPGVKELFAPLIQYFGPLPFSALNYALAVGIALLILVAILVLFPRLRGAAVSPSKVGSEEKSLLQGAVLVPWAAMPIILPFMISYLAIPIYTVRYTAPASLGIYLLVAIGVTQINRDYARIALVCVLIVTALIPLSGIYMNEERGEWRQATNHIESNTDATDRLIYLTNSYTEPNFRYYYSGDLTVKTQASPEAQNRLPPSVKQSNSVWAVFSYTHGRNDEIMNNFNDTHLLVGCEEYQRVVVCKYNSA
ncbi:glycosyltransferase family 39 protein [Halostella litorea]|uniref:glycosyltransferase family 39 protein n=1 Tax=Halostella litorea TaxID=2528831 RepID=UPI001387339D|nr:glycosyltransferase family 39 protein [Halostella litorea]